MSEYIGYIPRKCSYTRQLISASDCASIQISLKRKVIKKENEENLLFVIGGKLRRQGRSDGIINELVEKNDDL